MAIDVFCRFLPDILLLTKAPVFVLFDDTVIVYYYYYFNYYVYYSVVCFVMIDGSAWR